MAITASCKGPGLDLDPAASSRRFLPAPPEACEGANTVLCPCFGGSLAKMEVHKPPGIGNSFAVIAACYVYECIQGNSDFGMLQRIPVYYCYHAKYNNYANKVNETIEIICDKTINYNNSNQQKIIDVMVSCANISNNSDILAIIGIIETKHNN
jgi:hypothetical protein